MSRAQFNVRISQRTIRKVKMDKARSGETLDLITELAFENWFTKFDSKQRVDFYRAHRRQLA